MGLPEYDYNEKTSTTEHWFPEQEEELILCKLSKIIILFWYNPDQNTHSSLLFANYPDSLGGGPIKALTIQIHPDIFQI